MDSVFELYRKLCDLPEVIPHSQVVAHPKDIDLYVPITCMSAAREILKSNLYICIRKSECHSVYCKYIDGELFVFDLCCDYNHYFNLFSAVKFSDHGNRALGLDLALNKCLKRFSRQGNYDNSDFAILSGFFGQPENFISCPGNRLSDDGDVLLVSKLIFKKSKFGLLCLRLKVIISSLKSGKSFAFVGPDGSGKSFFIEKLKKVNSVKTVYMGDWFFKMQPLYSLLMKLPSPFNRFLYLFYFIENIIRRSKVAFWTFLGKTVFIDRFPGTNTPITLSGFPGFVNQLIFKLTPKPDLFVIMYASPIVVFKRKQELTISEIDAIQIKQKELLSGYSHVVINTEQLDDSLNCLLGKWYEL